MVVVSCRTLVNNQPTNEKRPRVGSGWARVVGPGLLRTGKLATFRLLEPGVLPLHLNFTNYCSVKSGAGRSPVGRCPVLLPAHFFDHLLAIHRLALLAQHLGGGVQGADLLGLGFGLGLRGLGFGGSIFTPAARWRSGPPRYTALSMTRPFRSLRRQTSGFSEGTDTEPSPQTPPTGC